MQRSRYQNDLGLPLYFRPLTEIRAECSQCSITAAFLPIT